MINKFYITGDTHGTPILGRLREASQTFKNLNHSFDNTALIILGDAGLNYFLDERDKHLKQEVEERGIYIYCVRGNHEVRPQDVPGMKLVYDGSVGNGIYMEDSYPHIRYFVDGGQYTIENYNVLVIGGAYSVDKYYRLATGRKWIENEQLNEDERKMIEHYLIETPQRFDFVFTHTCPSSWQPRDLFIRGIDQSTVDDSMEKWLDKLKTEIEFRFWCFGHYHEDRIERPGVEMFFRDICPLNEIPKHGDIDTYWWTSRGPNYGDKI